MTKEEFIGKVKDMLAMNAVYPEIKSDLDNLIASEITIYEQSKLREETLKNPLKVWIKPEQEKPEYVEPIVFDHKHHYIPCSIGQEVIMNTINGKSIIYEIIKIRKTSGGDWFYDSDAYNCDLKFKDVK